MAHPAIGPIYPLGDLPSGDGQVIDPVNIGLLAFGQVGGSAGPEDLLKIDITLVVTGPGSPRKAFQTPCRLAGKEFGREQLMIIYRPRLKASTL